MRANACTKLGASIKNGIIVKSVQCSVRVMYQTDLLPRLIFLCTLMSSIAQLQS